MATLIHLHQLHRAPTRGRLFKGRLPTRTNRHRRHYSTTTSYKMSLRPSTPISRHGLQITPYRTFQVPGASSGTSYRLQAHLSNEVWESWRIVRAWALS